VMAGGLDSQFLYILDAMREWEAYIVWHMISAR